MQLIQQVHDKDFLFHREQNWNTPFRISREKINDNLQMGQVKLNIPKESIKKQLDYLKNHPKSWSNFMKMQLGAS